MAAWPVRQQGSSGEDVRTVQYLLGVHGHAIPVDGQFGPATKAAVHAFQSGAGLPADGVVGDHTWEALIVTVVAGQTGARVRAVQGQLVRQGWRLPVDGDFGPVTTRSVRDFQTAHHLQVDGAAGPKTWHVLVAGFLRLGSPAQASSHLYEAWGARDRATALRNATQAAADLVLRGERGNLTDVGCVADPVLGAGHFVCTYAYEGGVVNFGVQGGAVDGYYVEWAGFVAD